MAEAVVDGTPMSRFFCHKCSVEIEDLLPDYTCPRCASGFIEELESGSDDSNSGTDLRREHDVLNLPRVSDRGQTSNTPNRNSVLANLNNVNSNNWYARQSYRGRGRQDYPASLQMFLQEFLYALAETTMDYSGTHDRQPPVLVFPNPQDFILGPDGPGFDEVVTNVLNQLDGTAGPPPLPKKQIDKIPTTTVTQSQVDSKMQCSVCWEDFKLSEPVKQLPCLHIYHAPCILPWLELHGTCPICRQNLGDQNCVEANQDTVGPSLAARFRAANESNSTRTSSTSSSGSSNSSASSTN
ncbi:E3 ubiquitin-protein ligase Iruka isoform X2 [Nomia melanderi]|uniref:E3 ubiquitin-protein ligase Iruka isoform X2 n=1 Tax=Nomia melanderi TaxID=2448451 RepID=UPI00130440D0|nr:E3 ubiquitin-protein ligase Iruka isoform X2 [Nomia melanderi]